MILSRRLHRTSTYVAPTLPDGFQSEQYSRLFANPSGNALVANLAVTPTMRTGPYADVVIHGLTQDFVVFLPDLVDLMADAAALTPPMRVAPGARLWPSTTATFDDCVLNTSYVSTMTAGFATLCDMAIAAGHRQIHIDAEQYSSDPSVAGAEPSVTWLISKGATEAQFRAVWKPFIDMLLSKGVSVTIGQFGKDFSEVTSSDDMQLFPLMVLEALGPDLVECFSEGTFFDVEKYRQDPKGSFVTAVSRQRSIEWTGTYYGGFPDLFWRPMINDDAGQLWGAAWPGSFGESSLLGNSKGIWYDWTRTNNAYRGTVAHYNGTVFVGGTPNDCDHVFAFSPTANGLAFMPSVGLLATGAEFLDIYTGTAGGLNPSALRCDDRWGITFNVPPAPNTYTYARMVGVLPNSASAPYSIDLDGFWIPSDVSGDMVIMCHGQSNVLVFQVVYLYASDKIQVQWGSSGATTYDLLAAPTKDAVHRVQIVRVDATHYRVGINAVAMATVVTPATVAFTTLQLGGGRDPSSPSTIGNWGNAGLKLRGAQSSVTGGTTSYLVGQVAIASRAWSTATDIVNVRAGHYPWGYGS